MSTPNSEVSRDVATPQLLGALFDFEAMPGRFPVALREPRLLFDNSRAVLIMAARRGMESLSDAEAEGAQRAAVFFVRTAMFRAAADHYTLLGLSPSCSIKQLSDHYRLLMRLIHPDFASTTNAWPRDAAARINQAQDILASPVRRADYDRSLANGLRQSIGVNSLAAVLPVPTQRSRYASRQGAFVAAGVTGVLVLGVLLFQLTTGTSPDDDSALSSAAPSAMQATQAIQATQPSSAKAAVLSDKPLEAKSPSLLAKASPTDPGFMPSLVTALKPSFILSSPPALAGPATPPVVVLKPDVRPSAVVKTGEARPPSAVRETLAISAGQTRDDAPKGVTAGFSSSVRPQASMDALPPQIQSGPSVPSPAGVAMAALAPAPVLTVPSAVPASDNPPSSVPSLADAQLVMGQLIQTMQSGRGEDMLRGLDRPLRQSSGAADLVLAYNHLVAGSRAVRLGAVQLRGRPQADRLVIDGVVPLVLQDQGQPAPVRELRLRALFVQRGGQVVMTELSSGGSRP